jgi:hypothetical protein
VTRVYAGIPRIPRRIRFEPEFVYGARPAAAARGTPDWEIPRRLDRITSRAPPGHCPTEGSPGQGVKNQAGSLGWPAICNDELFRLDRSWRRLTRRRHEGSEDCSPTACAIFATFVQPNEAQVRGCSLLTSSMVGRASHGSRHDAGRVRHVDPSRALPWIKLVVNLVESPVELRASFELVVGPNTLDPSAV